MNEKFINIDNDIFHHRKWYCSAKTKRCAEVTVKTLNTFLEENNQLKSELNVCEELVEVNKDYKKIEKDRDRLNNVVQHVWNVLLDIDRDELCFEERIFFDELCDKLGFDLSRIKMIEIDLIRIFRRRKEKNLMKFINKELIKKLNKGEIAK